MPAADPTSEPYPGGIRSGLERRSLGVALCHGAGRLLLRGPRAAALAVTAAWMLLIFSLSAQASPPGPGSALLSYVANLGHAPLYGLLALWVVLLLPRTGGWPRLGWAEVGWVLAAVLAYGISDELHQATVPGRSPSVLDLLTDLIGAAATLGVIAHVRSPAASPGGFWWRITVGLLACALWAVVSTFLPEACGSPRWL